MDFFELNKIGGSLLATIFVIFGLSFVADFVFEPDHADKPGYVIEVANAATGGEDTAKEEEPEESVLAMIGDADPAAGQKVAKKCAACHTFDNGGANKVGPNLWNIVNRKPGVHEGFSYSNALVEYGNTTNWTFEALDAYLTNPKTAIPGNKMSFAGLKKTKDRASMLAYLRSLADTPAELPSVGDTAAAETEEPAAEAPAAEAPAAEEPAAESSEEQTAQ